MKTLTKTLLAVTASTLFTAGANAALYTNTGYAGQAYFGAKAGQLSADVDNVDTDNATAYGVYAGYQFDPNWGAEVEYMGTDNADATRGLAKGEYDAKTYGAYGTYKYNFPASPVYGKAKLGVAKTEVSGNVGASNFSQDDTSLAGGVGLGYNATPNLAFEAEYDYLNSDANLWTVGAHYKF